MSSQYGYGGPHGQRPAPPPGVLPPPAAAPWQQGPGPFQQGPFQQGQFQQGRFQPGQFQQGAPYPGQWGQPYYGGPGQFNGFPPPRRRGGALRFILLGFILLVFVGVSLAVLGSILTRGSDDTAEPGVTGPSIVPTPNTNAQKGSAEDYLQHAEIYDAGALPEQNCPAADLGNGSLAAQKVYYQKLFTCLNDAWRPIFKDLGQSPPDPGLVVFDKPVVTPCGNFAPLSGRVLAFYCYGNQVMYTDVQQMNKAFGPKQDLAYLMTIAHEYGHHVQGVSGLFYARMAYLQDHPAEKLISSRRNELQASCFAGVFSKAVATSYPLTNRMPEFREQSSNSFGETPDTPEDERTHGLATSQGFWIQNGFNVGQTATCNTFAAPAGLVK